MGEFYREKLTTAAKPHRCDICDQPIAKGDTYLRISCMDQDADAPSSFTCHPECRAEEVRVNRGFDRDGWYDLGDWIDESGYPIAELGLSEIVTQRMSLRRQQIDERAEKFRQERLAQLNA